MTAEKIDPSLVPTRPSMIRTSSGRTIDPAAPRVADIAVADIAHALSMQCRWGGHVSRFYSVAEHSWHVSVEVERRTGSTYLALVALLHDGTEAYVVDLPRPIKRLLPGYYMLEERFARAIQEKFALGNDLVDLPHKVKVVDDLILNDERDQLFTVSDPHWSLGEERLGVKIECWEPDLADRFFINRYNALVSLIEQEG